MVTPDSPSSASLPRAQGVDRPGQVRPGVDLDDVFGTGRPEDAHPHPPPGEDRGRVGQIELAGGVPIAEPGQGLEKSPDLEHIDGRVDLADRPRLRVGVPFFDDPDAPAGGADDPAESGRRIDLGAQDRRGVSRPVGGRPGGSGPSRPGGAEGRPAGPGRHDRRTERAPCARPGRHGPSRGARPDGRSSPRTARLRPPRRPSGARPRRGSGRV